METAHEHEPQSRRIIPLRDGTRRTVLTCECGAIRTVDEQDDRRGGRVIASSEWRRRESEQTS